VNGTALRRAAVVFAVLGTLAGLKALSVGAAELPSSAPQYLDLGGSASVGFQPTATRPHGQRTDTGYANDLVGLTRSRWPGLQLTELGCPGASTTTFVDGGGRCRYGSGTQLAAAVAFLRSHPTTRLITVDLGFNNVRPCFVHGSVNEACVSRGLTSLRQQLPSALRILRTAAGSMVDIVGVGHYDPFASQPGGSRGDRSFAAASVGVIDELDATLRSIYLHFGIQMANVSTAFDTSGGTPVRGESSGPSAGTRVCELTWMCAHRPYGPNLHPNDAGYRVIARAIARVLPSQWTR
jgi:lysophospholipase L1-like esterase